MCSAPFTVKMWAVGQNSAQLLSSLPWPAIGRLFQTLQGAGKLLNEKVVCDSAQQTKTVPNVILG